MAENSALGLSRPRSTAQGALLRRCLDSRSGFRVSRLAWMMVEWLCWWNHRCSARKTQVYVFGRVVRHKTQKTCAKSILFSFLLLWSRWSLVFCCFFFCQWEVSNVSPAIWVNHRTLSCVASVCRSGSGSKREKILCFVSWRRSPGPVWLNSVCETLHISLGRRLFRLLSLS